jgi:alkylation response protein AidB-like acyl-CoA dehydrogenase
MASDLFAMEAVTWLPMAFVDRGGYDIRIEAAIAKLFVSERSWQLLDDALQIRGGRGFETATSLGARGEEPWPIERMFRDNRINTIIEGSSDIMYLFLAREALDPHLKAAGALVDPRSSFGEKFNAFLKAGAHYATWYPRQWAPSAFFASYAHLNSRLQGHGKFVAHKSKRLSRSIFHAMIRHQAGLEHRQAIMKRLVDIGVELYTMSATCARATMMVNQNPADASPLQLADHYCKGARRRVRRFFSDLLCNDDASSRKISKSINAARVTWLEDGIVNTVD